MHGDFGDTCCAWINLPVLVCSESMLHALRAAMNLRNRSKMAETCRHTLLCHRADNQGPGTVDEILRTIE